MNGTVEQHFGRVLWLRVILGILVTAIISLSVHAVMLQVLHVPYPYGYPTAGWPAYPRAFFSTLGALYLYPKLDQRFARLSTTLRCFMFFLLLASIRETLFRAAFMNIMNSSSVFYPIVEVIPKLLPIAIIASLVVLYSTSSTPAWTRWAAALIISASVFFLCTLINSVFDKILGSIAGMASPGLYDPPYDYHILIPAYLSFLEPVIATFFAAALTWNRLPRQRTARIAAFTLLIFLIKGPVVEPIIHIWFSHFKPLVAMLSMAQFSFEALLLGLLVSVFWSIVHVPQPQE